ncbi:hypothetical protein [Amycolatopsis sp. NPDC004625]|uniref:hypothetical protein n=1 Tax=Amycolatopsis sp. NPDC004625 TaxID=3154670 RepID=UPI0033B5180C
MVAQGGGLFVGVDGLWHSMHVNLLYDDACGAIAETKDLTSPGGTGSPRCAAYIDRSDDGGNTWVNEVEAMSAGDGETRIANDLNGRLARGSVVCTTGVGNPSVVGQTSWY